MTHPNNPKDKFMNSLKDSMAISTFNFSQGFNSGYQKALNDELKFLESPIKEGEGNWVKNRIKWIKKSLQEKK